MIYKAVCILCLVSCANTGPWTLDKISAGNASYDLVRLVYQSKESRSPLRLEFLKMGEASDLVISFTESSIYPSQANPLGAIVYFTLGENLSFEEMVPLSHGNMRLHPSKDSCAKIIKALQEGLKIDIVVDDVEMRISPQGFTKNYNEFIQ